LRPARLLCSPFTYHFAPADLIFSPFDHFLLRELMAHGTVSMVVSSRDNERRS
jgi:hypothetical protein